jgi:hypothetical protein
MIPILAFDTYFVTLAHIEQVECTDRSQKLLFFTLDRYKAVATWRSFPEEHPAPTTGIYISDTNIQFPTPFMIITQRYIRKGTPGLWT